MPDPMHSLIVDFTHPALWPRDVLTLTRLQTLRERYISQGRGREAHGVSQAITILWHTLVHPNQTAPDSQMATLQLDIPVGSAPELDPDPAPAPPTPATRAEKELQPWPTLRKTR